MGLVEQWRRIGSELPAGWSEARLALTLPRAAQRERAALLLSPASPNRVGETLHFSVRRSGGGIGPDQCTKLLGKLDAERIRGTLALLETVERELHEEPPNLELAVAWAAAVAELPPDWSDLYCELELDSSDYLDRAALLAGAAEPRPRAGPQRLPLPRRPELRLRRLAADDRSLPRARRRGRHHGPVDNPPRALRHPQRRDPGARLARRGQGGLEKRDDGYVAAMSGDPVSWLMVEPGWTVVDAHGKKVGKVDEVLGDEQIDIFHGLVVSGEKILADQVAEIHEGEVRLVR